MLDEIKELRRMLEFTMSKYNELLERVDKLESRNTVTYCTSTREPRMYGTSVGNTSRTIGDDGNLYINNING